LTGDIVDDERKYAKEKVACIDRAKPTRPECMGGQGKGAFVKSKEGREEMPRKMQVLKKRQTGTKSKGAEGENPARG